MGPMSLHHDKVKQLAAASHGACSSQAAGCDSCVGAVPEGNVSKFRKTNKRPSRICGGFFVYDLSGGLHSSRT